MMETESVLEMSVDLNKLTQQPVWILMYIVLEVHKSTGLLK